jgi:hypothetical protein
MTKQGGEFGEGIIKIFEVIIVIILIILAVFAVLHFNDILTIWNHKP